MLIKTGRALPFLCVVLHRHNLHPISPSNTWVFTAKIIGECLLWLGTQNLTILFEGYLYKFNFQKFKRGIITVKREIFSNQSDSVMSYFNSTITCDEVSFDILFLINFLKITI